MTTRAGAAEARVAETATELETSALENESLRGKLDVAESERDRARAERDSARAELAELEDAAHAFFVAALLEADPELTAEQADCIVDSLAESLDFAEMLRSMADAPAPDDPLPSEFERALARAYLEC